MHFKNVLIEEKNIYVSQSILKKMIEISDFFCHCMTIIKIVYDLLAFHRALKMEK